MESLPTDVLRQIVRHVGSDHVQVLKLQCNREFRRIIQDDLVWKYFTLSFFSTQRYKRALMWGIPPRIKVNADVKR